MDNREKHLVLLEFKREALLYDLKNLGYIITDSAAKQTPEDKHNLADIGEDGNVDRVTRMMDLAHANVMQFLAKYVEKKLDEDTYGHDVLLDVDSYFVLLNILASIPGSAIGSLRTFIHEYIIAFTMEDWVSIVSPELQPIWAAKVAALEEKIKTCLSIYYRGMRIKQHPFP